MAGPFNRGDTIINQHFTFTFYMYEGHLQVIRGALTK